MTSPLVSALVLNYNADYEMLKDCLGSLQKQTYPDFEIVVVDNGSKNGVLERIEKEFSVVRVERLGKNHGFAGGINRALKLAKGSYVMVLNFDVKLDPKAVEELVKVAENDERIAGVAPKMLFHDKPAIFDSIGNLIDPAGRAFNQGIGQVDIGQYDQVERTFGVCFGAALLRKSAFDSEKVGSLDESYFMYYEDIDWCYRANLYGYKFYTAPKAVVYHVHSAASRKLPYSFKYRLIELNLLRTVYKNYNHFSALQIFIRRGLLHLANIVRGRFVGATLSLIITFLLDLPRLTFKRRKIQKRKKVDEFDVVKYSFGEAPFFSPDRYEPDYSVGALAAMYGRLYLLKRDEKIYEKYLYLQALSKSKIQYNTSWLKKMLLDVLAGESDSVLDFVRQMREE